MTSLPKWLQEIEEREQAASPGPWKMNPRSLYFYDSKTGQLDLEKFTNESALSEDGQNGDHLGADLIGPPEPGRASFVVRDAWFLAHSREDIPRLLALAKDALELAEIYQGAACWRPNQWVGPGDKARAFLEKWGKEV